MSPVISSRNVPGPAVVACLTGFADRMGESLNERLARGGASATIRVLGSTDDPSTRVAQALIEVQDIRLSGGAVVRPPVGPIVPPLVVAVAAAAELRDLSTLGRLAQVAHVTSDARGGPARSPPWSTSGPHSGGSQGMSSWPPSTRCRGST